MELAVQTRGAADPILSAVNAARSGQTAQSGKTADRNDFETMVKQKRQDAAQGQDAKKTDQTDKPAQAEKAVKPAKGQESDTPAAAIPAEQYILAAALILQPGVELVPVLATPEQTGTDVEIAPVFVPDMRIESVADLPVERPAETGQQQTLTEYQEDADPEQPVFLEEEVAEYVDRPVESDVPVEMDTDTETEAVEAVPLENVRWEAPVFGYMEATPVKVASTAQERPIDLEADDGIEQVASRVETVLVDGEEGASRVEFTLIPASLGKVTVEITRTADGALHVQMNATTVRAAEILQRHTGQLRYLLGADTRPEVDVQVRSEDKFQPLFYLNPDGSGQERQNQHNRQGQREPRHRHQTADFLQQLRLGLVDLDAV